MICDPAGCLCRECGEIRPCQDFYPDSSKRRGHGSYCRSCMKARVAARHVENREASLAYMSEYAKRPEIVARRNARHSEDKARIVALYGGSCACCGEAEPQFLTLDHIDSDGATHRANDPVAGSMVAFHRRNSFQRDPRLQLLCWNCNCSKGIFGACPHALSGQVTGS